MCSCLFSVMPVQNLPFIQNMEKRIQSASLLLDASLGHCFVDGLEHRDENVIYNCLRAYAAIDNTSSAEEIFRTTVVAPSIQKIIPHGPSGVVVGASGDGLENDYQEIKKCIEKDCKFLLEISSAGTSIYLFYHFYPHNLVKPHLNYLAFMKYINVCSFVLGLELSY